MPRCLRLPCTLIALVWTVACGQEIGEICEDDSDCKSERCVHGDWPAAADTRQCSQTCEAGCPDGTICITGYCMRECSIEDANVCPDETACFGTFSACFATCNDDSVCENNTCSSEQLCNGE